MTEAELVAFIGSEPTKRSEIQRKFFYVNKISLNHTLSKLKAAGKIESPKRGYYQKTNQ